MGISQTQPNTEPVRTNHTRRTLLPERTHASAFFGVERFGVAFLVVAAFFAGAFFVAALVGAAAFVLVTRPDLVLLRTAKSSLGRAGAAVAVVAAALRGLLAFAFGLAAGFAVVVFLAVAVFLVAGALVFCAGC